MACLWLGVFQDSQREALMMHCVAYGHPAGPTVTRRQHSQACNKGPECTQGAQSDLCMPQSPDVPFLWHIRKIKAFNTMFKVHTTVA